MTTYRKSLESRRTFEWILLFVFLTVGALALCPAAFWPFKMGLGVLSSAAWIGCTYAAVRGHDDAKQFAWYFFLLAAVIIAFHYGHVPQF